MSPTWALRKSSFSRGKHGFKLIKGYQKVDFGSDQTVEYITLTNQAAMSVLTKL